MSTWPTPARGGRLAALGDTLADVRGAALAASDELLRQDPEVGDPACQREVDTFVEQASDTLRALAESLHDCLPAGSLDRVAADVAADPVTERWSW